jgi:hypothetical protein
MFRLTYFVGGSHVTDKWECENRYEVWGSAEAICDLFFHLRALEKLSFGRQHECACPRFIKIWNKDGQDVTGHYHTGGLQAVAATQINTFK